MLKTGNEKMTVKDRFSPEDWATLVQAPLMAAMAIVAVSPSLRQIAWVLGLPVVQH
jgi:hypothetical protein